MWYVSNDGSNYVVVRYKDGVRLVSKTFGNSHQDKIDAEKHATFLNVNVL